MKTPIKSNLTVLLLLFSATAFAQNNNPELDTLLAKALKNNKGIRAAQLQVDKMKSNIKTAYKFEKTNIYYAYDQNNIAVSGEALPVWGVQQKFAFPTVYSAQKKLNKAEYEREIVSFEIQKKKLTLEVSKIYQQIVFLQHQERLYKYLDSLYQNFSKASDRRFELGETNYLEKITAQSKYRKISTTLSQIDNERKANYEQLQSLLQTDEIVAVKSNSIVPIQVSNLDSIQKIYTDYFQRVSDIYKSAVHLQKQNWFPDLNFDYFQGRVSGLSPLHGVQIGVSLPILFTEQKAKTKVAELDSQSWEQQKKNELQRMQKFITQKGNELTKYQEGINYYNLYGKKLSDEILRVASMSYKNGEIDFFQYILSLDNATTIHVEYLDSVLQYNKTQLDLQYLNF